MLDEGSKAVQEIAKTSGKAIDAGREMGSFIAKYIGGSIEQAMGIWEDKLKYRRWENQIRLAEKARAVLKARGLDAPSRTVHLAIAIPLLEEASLADSDELQDRWAMLLANAADANGPTMRRAYVSILAEMTALDVIIIQKLFDAGLGFIPDDIYDHAVFWTVGLPEQVTLAEKHTKLDGKLTPDVELSLVNLARLGLLDSEAAFSGLSNVQWVALTELGRQFVIACRAL